MDSDLLLDYLDRVIKPYLERNHCLEHDSVMILDQFSAHMTDTSSEAIADLNLSPVFIPSDLQRSISVWMESVVCQDWAGVYTRRQLTIYLSK